VRLLACGRAVSPQRALAALALALLLAGCKVDLYTRLGERDANEMVAILQEHGIAAERSVADDKTSSVAVDEASFADAVRLLKERGYPRQSYVSMGEVFSGDKLVSSPLEDRARLVYALGQELSRTIADVDGVLSARVHIVLPTDDPLRQSATPSSASVFIRHDAAAPVGKLEPQIKTFVANSIEGLSYDKVSVVMVAVALPPRAAPQARAAEALTNVAGIWVERESAARAAMLIYALLGLASLGLGSAALLCWRWRSRVRPAAPRVPARPSIV
jgi:type III secretion protein J